MSCASELNWTGSWRVLEKRSGQIVARGCAGSFSQKDAANDPVAIYFQIHMAEAGGRSCEDWNGQLLARYLAAAPQVCEEWQHGWGAAFHRTCQRDVPLRRIRVRLRE